MKFGNNFPSDSPEDYVKALLNLSQISKSNIRTSLEVAIREETTLPGDEETQNLRINQDTWLVESFFMPIQTYIDINSRIERWAQRMKAKLSEIRDSTTMAQWLSYPLPVWQELCFGLGLGTAGSLERK